MTSEHPYKLHLGWHANTSDPMLIDFHKLSNHGAVLAQSGAGKSTLVGRLVEEILVKTRARVVVLDANGDFRKAHLVADAGGREGEVWTHGIRPPLDSFDHDEFERRWRNQPKIYLTYSRAHEPADGVEWVEPYVSWKKLPRQWQMEVLGLELSRNPDEVAALYRVAQRLADNDDTNIPVSPLTVENELSLLASTSTGMNRLDERTLVSLRMRFRQAAELDLWQQEADHADLSRCFEKQPRLLVLDVPSVAKLKGAKGAMILVAHLLEALWNLAQHEWDEAMENPAEDPRTPTFVVLDEAHNFVPAEDPIEPLALRISRTIQRIAAEGRKYGLFLLLATQRPPKVRPGLLSECPNVCLMSLQSPIDHKLVMEIWGLEVKRTYEIARFPPAHGLLCGQWADGGEIHFRGGRRHTKETGGNLRKDWILTR